MLDRLQSWVRGQLRRFNGKSWEVHTSLPVTDLVRATTFYQKLGFERVSASRGEEITLMRHVSGTELNLVLVNDGQASRAGLSANAAISVTSLDRTIADIRRAGIKTETGPVDGPNSRWLTIRDPDWNAVEFYQTLENPRQTESALFHLVTSSELAAGLSDDYYLPPDDERRFVYCRIGSSILLLAAARLNKRIEPDLILVRMDANKVSLAPGIGFDDDIDKPLVANDIISTYPDVYSPIPRDAISGAAQLSCDSGSHRWPDRFESLESVLA